MCIPHVCVHLMNFWEKFFFLSTPCLQSGTCSVGQNSKDSPVTASQVQRLEAYATTAWYHYILFVEIPLTKKWQKEGRN